MKNIAGGTFQMGNSIIPTESPVHTVTLTAFSMSATEITQSAWIAIMGNNPSSFIESMRPVESVSYLDILEFISRLNQVSGKTYRLPTEAEWEFAAKGGVDTTTIWSGTSIADSLVNFGWFSSGSNNQTHAVATKRPNKLGLYDMSGNVWEYCSDHYESYTSSAQTNPTGPVSTQDIFVIRGGAWNSDGLLCKKSSRSYNYSNDRKYTAGFRLAM
jgi:formylglycine-generating enzyme required for sulfatase activity